MIRGTTPTHTFTLPFDSIMIAKARIIYSQNDNIVLTKTPTIDGNTLSVKLTQEDTFKLNPNHSVEIQVRVLTPGNDSLASEIIRVPVSRCLEEDLFV